MVVERLIIKNIVHPIDNIVDLAFHLAFAVDNSTSPVPGLENSKDVLDGVQFWRVGREEYVADVFSRRKALVARA